MLGGVESPTTNSVSLGLGCIPTAKQNLAYRYCSWKNLKVTHFPPYPLYWIHILVAEITFCFWLNRHFRCFNHHFCWSNHSVRCQKHKSSDYGSNHSFLVDKSTIIIIISLFLMLDPLGFPIIFLLYSSYYIPVVSLFTICHIVFPTVSFFSLWFPFYGPIVFLLYIYIYLSIPINILIAIPICIPISSLILIFHFVFLVVSSLNIIIISLLFSY